MECASHESDTNKDAHDKYRTHKQSRIMGAGLFLHMGIVSRRLSFTEANVDSSYIFSGAEIPRIYRPFLRVMRAASVIATLCVASSPSIIRTSAYQRLKRAANSMRKVAT